MSDKFPIDEAQIVGLFMECVFYGMYLVTFGLCMRALLFQRDHAFVWKSKKDIRWGMLAIALAMCLFGTLDVAFGLRHNLDAFIFYRGSGGAAEEFHNIRYWVNIMKTVDYVAQTAIGDAVLNYRCWMVYNKRWIIVAFPILMWMATVACGCAMIWVEATTHQDALLNETRIRPLLDSIVVLTLVVNVLVTSMIVWRIWNVRRKTIDSSTHPNKLMRVIRIIVDSGLMYTVSVIIFFGTTLAGSNAQYGVSDVVVQIIGIAFNLIIIRVSNGTAPDGLPFSTSSGLPSTTYPMHFLNTSINPPTFTVRTEIGVEVEVSRVTEHDGEVVKADEPWKGPPGNHWREDTSHTDGASADEAV